MIIEVSEDKTVELLDRVANFFVERRLGSASLMFIESIYPLNFIISQLMYFVAPFAEIIFNPVEYQQFAAIIKKEENIKYLLDKIDELDTEFHKKLKEEKKKDKYKHKKRRQRFFRKLSRLLGKRD
ncbi:MAG: hypothetical protein DRH57_00420 [Candidatus Cloacimonadota bacterium]|nr:MAG: hypothetical protein DRH57_00420 [Candidatus Cloacimonadota bacterium]